MVPAMIRLNLRVGDFMAGVALFKRETKMIGAEHVSYPLELLKGNVYFRQK